jgi:hypothetical protein
MNGCCVDKKYGKGCIPDTCMTLPEGRTCEDCYLFTKCEALLQGIAERRTCDFFPRKFEPKSYE